MKLGQYFIYSLGGFLGTIPTISAQDGFLVNSVAFIFALGLTILAFDFYKQYMEKRHRAKMWTCNYEEI